MSWTIILFNPLKSSGYLVELKCLFYESFFSDQYIVIEIINWVTAGFDALKRQASTTNGWTLKHMHESDIQ